MASPDGDEVREALAYFDDARNYYSGQSEEHGKTLAAEVRRLQAELAGVQADAERYRWLRDESSNDFGPAVREELKDGDPTVWHLKYGRLDAAIDAATEARTLRTASTSEGR